MFFFFLIPKFINKILLLFNILNIYSEFNYTHMAAEKKWRSFKGMKSKDELIQACLDLNLLKDEEIGTCTIHSLITKLKKNEAQSTKNHQSQWIEHSFKSVTHKQHTPHRMQRGGDKQITQQVLDLHSEEEISMLLSHHHDHDGEIDSHSTISEMMKGSQQEFEASVNTLVSYIDDNNDNNVNRPDQSVQAEDIPPIQGNAGYDYSTPCAQIMKQAHLFELNEIKHLSDSYIDTLYKRRMDIQQQQRISLFESMRQAAQKTIEQHSEDPDTVKHLQQFMQHGHSKAAFKDAFRCMYNIVLTERSRVLEHASDTVNKLKSENKRKVTTSTFNSNRKSTRNAGAYIPAKQINFTSNITYS